MHVRGKSGAEFSGDSALTVFQDSGLGGKEHYILFRATHSEKTIGLKSQGTHGINMSPIIA